MSESIISIWRRYLPLEGEGAQDRKDSLRKVLSDRYRIMYPSEVSEVEGIFKKNLEDILKERTTATDNLKLAQNVLNSQQFFAIIKGENYA